MIERKQERKEEGWRGGRGNPMQLGTNYRSQWTIRANSEAVQAQRNAHPTSNTHTDRNTDR